MAEFFLTIENKNADAVHYIHNANCGDLPELSTLRYLGSFASGDAAFSKSRGLFNNIAYCDSCFPGSS